MAVDRSIRYEDADKFFELGGSSIMKLTVEGALEVCVAALEHGFAVVRIEGGIWHDPGFEARRDCIWDKGDTPMSHEEAKNLNDDASEFIRSMASTEAEGYGRGHDVFILMAGEYDKPIREWRKSKSD